MNSRMPVVSETITERAAVSSAAAVAADIRRRMPETDGALLHRLLYFVQGRHLVWGGRPAFEEDFEAWPQGPVVASLWHAEVEGAAARTCGPLPESLHNVVTSVLCHQRENGCTEFVDDISDPDPWTRATDRGRNVAGQLISKQCLIDYFSVESPSLVRLRRSVAAVRDDRPFAPSPPGALDSLVERYLPGASL